MAEAAALAELRLDELQERLKLRFRTRALLREAMTHASWVNERGETGPDNERLEYLGDAVLELVAGEYLFRRFPTYDEGQLTQLRSSLVNTQALAKLGEQLQLGETLRMGRGAAKTGARRLTSLLANAFEALIGAAFLDQGYRVAGRIFLSRIGDLREWTDTNFKGRLQALAQERFGNAPAYRIVATGGPGHSREYAAEAVLDQDRVLGSGRGGTKQAAQQAAARAAIDALTAPPPRPRRRRRSGRSVAPVGDQVPPVGDQVPPAASIPADPEDLAVDVAVAAARAVVSATEALGGVGAAEAVRPTASASRRRRRSRRSAAAAAGSSAGLVRAVPEAAEAVPAGAAVAPPVVGGAPEAEHQPSGGLATEPAAAGDEGGEPRRRTRRGHRGGRRRSGRGAAGGADGSPVASTDAPAGPTTDR
ncbi:MAG TPA: ribonuclease III [Candidatus Micrarchaeia archaeon]|nr:ribonuclease III [Candidatus Micrarchaeia archaeon]